MLQEENQNVERWSFAGVPLRRSSRVRGSTSKTPKRQACVVFARVSTIYPREIPLLRSLAGGDE